MKIHNRVPDCLSLHSIPLALSATFAADPMPVTAKPSVIVGTSAGPVAPGKFQST